MIIEQAHIVKKKLVEYNGNVNFLEW